MTRHQNRLALFVAQRNRGRYRMTVYAGVAGIKKLHGFDGGFAAAKGQADPVIQAQVISLNRGQPLVNIGINAVVLLPQNLGVFRISTDPLDTEKDRVL